MAMTDGVMLGPLVLFAAAMCLTPGPNVVLVVASSVNFGFRGAVPHILGISIGFGLMAAAIGLGLAGLFEAEPALHGAVRYFGAAYLLYLAWRIAWSTATVSDREARPIGFLEAVLFQWLNPKGWATAVGAFATYTPVGADTWRQTSVVTAVLAVACSASVVLWAAFGAGMSRFLATPRIRSAFNWSMAGLLVLSLVPVFW